MEEQKFGIIIQARLGSTRLKNKLKRNFYADKSLVEIVFDNISQLAKKYKIIVATTDNIADDFIEKTALDYQFDVYRGSENNVLSRFIESAEKYKVQNIVRVCCDNPFIQIKEIEDLIKEHDAEISDYTSFFFNNGRPIIRSHLGMYVEVVSLKALKEIALKTDKNEFLEHVTNYIYANPDQFNITRLPLPIKEEDADGVRLTIDTEEDFKSCSLLYAELFPAIDQFSIIDHLKENETLMETMKEQIVRNEK